MGNVLSAGVGQAPARQAALAAGLPHSCVCTTVNKVCSSGLKAITLAASEIALGCYDVAVAGGMENMSLVPHYTPSMRFGLRMGDATLQDGVLRDGLVDPGSQQHMGMCAETCATRQNIPRQQQDAYARSSYARSVKAWKAGDFAAEIEPVVVPNRHASVIVDTDEECFRTDVTSLDGMRPSFRKDGAGTVTAGNASGLNDGAAAVVLMSARAAEKAGVAVLAHVRGFADAEQKPVDFTTAPAAAVPKALERASLSLRDIDVFEINEAFAVVALANLKLLGLSEERVNLLGGAIALGHPIGCSGARILVTLLSVLRKRGARYGVAAICNGGGGATALVIEQNCLPSSHL